jgi:hypothetical protein
MSTIENKDIVRRQWYQELWDNWKLSAADELLQQLGAAPQASQV